MNQHSVDVLPVQIWRAAVNHSATITLGIQIKLKSQFVLIINLLTSYCSWFMTISQTPGNDLDGQFWLLPEHLRIQKMVGNSINNYNELIIPVWNSVVQSVRPEGWVWDWSDKRRIVQKSKLPHHGELSVSSWLQVGSPQSPDLLQSHSSKFVHHVSLSHHLVKPVFDCCVSRPPVLGAAMPVVIILNNRRCIWTKLIT